MIRKLFMAGAAFCLVSTAAQAENAACPAVDNATLKSKLKTAIQQTGGGGGLALGLNMWATIVAPDGRVCIVANSSDDPIQGQWLASRVISAQKAFTAATLSLGQTPDSGSGTGLAAGKLALSTANLYSAVNPGGSLYGLQHSNPVAAAGAYGDRLTISGGGAIYSGPGDTSKYGTRGDPMIGQVIGGINVFGGGLALYESANSKVGGVGVSGDTSCADHLIAWRLRNLLGLDRLAGVGGVSGDKDRPDNIVFDIVVRPPGQGGGEKSQSGWGHPTCLGVTNKAATGVANGLPKVQ